MRDITSDKEPNIFHEKSDKNHPFVNISKNGFLNDKELSWGAKGLMAYLMALPPDWQIYLKQLAAQSTNKYEATSSLVRELTNAGYIIRSSMKQKNEKGQFQNYTYKMFESKELAQKYQKKSLKHDSLDTVKQDTDKPNRENPDQDSPDLGTPDPDQPGQGNPALLNNNSNQIPTRPNIDSNQTLTRLKTKKKLSKKKTEKTVVPQEQEDFLLIVQTVNDILPSKYRWSGLIPGKYRANALRVYSIWGIEKLKRYTTWFVQEKLESPASTITSFNWGIFLCKGIIEEFKEYDKRERERDSYLKTTSKWKGREPIVLKQRLENSRNDLQKGIITQIKFNEYETYVLKRFKELGLDYDSFEIPS